MHAEELVDGCKTCKWQLELVQKPDVFAFKNAHSGRYLSVEAGVGAKANAVIGGKDLSLDERKWQLVRASSETWTCAPSSINETTCRAQAIHGTEEYLFVGRDSKCDWDFWSPRCASGCCKRRLDCSGAVKGAIRRIKAGFEDHECKCEKVNEVEYYLRGNGFWEGGLCWGQSGTKRYFNVIDLVNSNTDRSCTCEDTRRKTGASDNSIASNDSATASNTFLAAAPDSIP